MARLSVALIVKDESENLADCLATVSFADEIVILDSGSSDTTVDIARQYTDKVFSDNDWQGFGVQRQRLQVYCQCEWILMLDADERVTPELAQQIQSMVTADERQTVYALPRLSWCFGRFIRHSGWYPDYVERLYAKQSAQYGNQLVHEKLQYQSHIETQKLCGDLLHFTYRDLQHYLVKSASYAAAWADQRQNRGEKSSLAQGMLHGVACFIKMYVFRLGFLDGQQGLLLALLSAHSTFAKYADLWVRQQASKP